MHINNPSLESRLGLFVRYRQQYTLLLFTSQKQNFLPLYTFYG